MAVRCFSCGEPFTSTSHTEKNQNDKFKSTYIDPGLTVKFKFSNTQEES